MTRIWKTVLILMFLMPVLLFVALTGWYVTAQSTTATVVLISDDAPVRVGKQEPLERTEQAKVDSKSSPKFDDRVWGYRAEPLFDDDVEHNAGEQVIAIKLGAKDGVQIGNAFQICSPTDGKSCCTAKVIELENNRCVAKIVSPISGEAEGTPKMSLQGFNAVSKPPKTDADQALLVMGLADPVWRTESVQNKVIRELLEVGGEHLQIIVRQDPERESVYQFSRPQSAKMSEERGLQVQNYLLNQKLVSFTNNAELSRPSDLFANPNQSTANAPQVRNAEQPRRTEPVDNPNQPTVGAPRVRNAEQPRRTDPVDEPVRRTIDELPSLFPEAVQPLPTPTNTSVLPNVFVGHATQIHWMQSQPEYERFLSSNDDARAARLEFFRKESESAEKRSIERANFIREQLKNTPGDMSANLRQALKAELRTAVFAAFKARHDLQILEVAALRLKLGAMDYKLQERQDSYADIVDRRVEELLNPNKQWNAESPAANTPLREATAAEPSTGDENKLLIRRSETSVMVEGRFDGNEEIVLVIGDLRLTAVANTAPELKGVKELKWTSPVNKAGEYVIEVRQDAVTIDGGGTAPGLVFQVHNVPNTVQSTSNISFTDKDPLPNGKVVIASPKTKLLLKRKTDHVLVTVGHVELPKSLNVVPINIVIRRKAGMNVTYRGEQSVDANVTLPQPAPQKDADKVSEVEASLDRKNARSVVEAYIAAALAGRVDEAASLAKGTPAGRNQIESLPRQLNVQRLVINSVHMSDPAKPKTALALSEAVTLTRKQPNGQRDGCLGLTLTLSEEGWFVTDIDFESEESTEDELKRFIEGNPNAVRVPSLNADVLPGTDRGSRSALQPTGKQLGTVLGKPIHEGDLNKNVSTGDNLKRLLLQPLTEHYCRKHKLDRAEDLQRKIKDEKRRAMARLFVLPAELNRHLFEKHGGRVILTPFGPIAFDGMKKWLEEREQAGDFELTDPDLKTKFRERWMQEPADARFASPDEIKAAFDPALTDLFIESLTKEVEATNKTSSHTFPVDEVKGHIASIKQRTKVAAAVAELHRLTGLDYGNGVDADSRQAWLEWWDDETSNIDSAKDGLREFVVTGIVASTTNGKPIVGAIVTAHVPFKASPSGKYQLATTHADLNGRYVLALGIPLFATPEESTWTTSFSAQKPPGYVADQLPVTKKLQRQKRDDTDTVTDQVQDTLEKNNDTIFAGAPIEMNLKVRPVAKPVRPAAGTGTSPKTEQPVPLDKLPDDKANDAQSEARSENGQTKIAIGKIQYSLPFSFPSVDLILSQMPDGKARPKHERIECELVKYQVSEARLYPLVGPAQLVQAHFKSTITSEAGRDVIYSDSSQLIRVPPE